MIDRKVQRKYLAYFFLALGVIVVFSIFLNVLDCFDNTVFLIFQNRDIGRARELLAGNFIFYGPEMTGGGNLPGPLYYVFLAISQAFSKTWISAWIMQYVLLLIGVVVGSLFFRTKASPRIVLTWLIFVSFAPFTYNYIRMFLNVSSLYVFAVLTLIFIYQIYDLNVVEKIKFRSFYLACLSIGIGLQFHFSIICFFISLILINIFSRRLELFRIPFKVFLKGTAFLILPCLPYIIWLLLSKVGIQVGAPAFYAGESVNAPLSLLQLMTYGYDENLLQVFSKITLSIIPVPFFILAPLMFIKDQGNLDQPIGFDRIKPFILCSLVSFVLVLELCFSPQASRYTLPFCLAMVFLSVGMYEKILKSDSLLKKFNIGAGVAQLLMWVYIYIIYPKQIYYVVGYSVLSSVAFLILLKITDSSFKFKQKAFVISFLLLSSLGVGQHRLFKLGAYTMKDWALFIPRYEDWKSIWGDINNATGWDYETAKGRIYYIGHHLEQDPGLALEQFKNPQQSSTENDQTPSGFFVSSRYRTYARRRFQKIPTPAEWLINQNLQPEVKKGILDGDIRLGTNISKEYMILPYWVINNKNVPDYFHNMGEGYFSSANDKKLSLVKESEGVVRSDASEYIFKWNECVDGNDFCSTGAIVNLEKKKDSNYVLDVLVVGAALSQITPWVSPNWTQAWINPYAEVTCDNGEKVNFLIASSIGFNRSVSQDVKTPILQGNNSFVGPFRKKIGFVCVGGVKKIAIGRSFSKIETISEVKNIPGKILNIDI